MKRTLSTLAAIVIAAQVMQPVQAALIDRGRGLIYDTALDITWLQNANLAQTERFGVTSGPVYQGIEADGSMSWQTANAWIAGMNQARYLGNGDWRLPAIEPPFGGFLLTCVTYDGSSECGYNIADARHELAHLFYSSLANLGAYDTTGNPQALGTRNLGPFTNVAPARYWTGTGLPPHFGPVQAFAFDFRTGLKEWDHKFEPYYMTYAWAVRDGDISPIPEPGVFALLLVGVGTVLLGAARRFPRPGSNTGEGRFVDGLARLAIHLVRGSRVAR